MPRGDGTGPRGIGARTGRAAGWCAGFEMPGYANSTPRGEVAMRCGIGRGWRNVHSATGLPRWARFGGHGMVYCQTDRPEGETQKQLLKRQAEELQAELDLVKKRLAEVENKSAME